MTVQEVLRKTQKFFQEKGIETARLDAELLLSDSLNWNRVDLYTKFDYPMGETELDLCREKVRRRANGEPVAYILQKKGFYNYDFIVTPDVLIPRPETEGLVEAALAVTKSGNKVVDLGCGSGCIGLSIIKERENTKLVSVDISESALKVARKNAEALELTDRVEFRNQSAEDVDLSDIDLIVANPPYVDREDDHLDRDVRAFEPELALYAEEDGLACIKAWTEKAISMLKPGGHFFCEFGLGQRPSIEKFIEEQANSELIFHRDLAGIERFFHLRK